MTNSRPCNSCGQIKPITSEHWQSIPNSTDGFRKTCLECKSAKDRARYESIREQRIQAVQAWYQVNRHKKQSYDANRRVQRNKEQLSQRVGLSKLSSQVLPVHDMVFRMNNCSNQSKLTPMFPISPKDIRRMWNRQRMSCFYCELPFINRSDIEIDHIIPVSRGGENRLGNYCLSCSTCNRSKAHRLVIEFKHRRIVLRESVIKKSA